MWNEYLSQLGTAAIFIGTVMFLFWLWSVKAHSKGTNSMMLTDLSFLCMWIELKTMRGNGMTIPRASTLFISFLGIGLSIWLVAAALMLLFATEFTSLFLSLS